MRNSRATAVCGSSFADTRRSCPLRPSGLPGSSESVAPPTRQNWFLMSRPLWRCVTPQARSSGHRFRVGFRRLASARSPRTACIDLPSPRRRSFRPCNRRALLPIGSTATLTPGREMSGHHSKGHTPLHLAGFVRIRLVRSIPASSHTPPIGAKAMLCAWLAPWRRKLSRRGSWCCIRRCYPMVLPFLSRFGLASSSTPRCLRCASSPERRKRR